jgi:hypothetical protein
MRFHVLLGGPLTSSDVIEWISKYDDSDIEKRENIMEMPGKEASISGMRLTHCSVTHAGSFLS